jgi:hypothetical protein
VDDVDRVIHHEWHHLGGYYTLRANGEAILGKPA